MKSIWVFLLGLLFNVAFILLILVSYWVNTPANLSLWGSPKLLFYLLILAALPIAGIWARNTDRPRLANIMVILLPASILFTVLFFVLIFNLKSILPHDFGLTHVLVLLLAVFAVFASVKLAVGKHSMLHKIFETASKTAPQQKNQFDQGDAKVLFIGTGCSGQVTYESKEGSFSMYFEFGGGAVLATIDVPSSELWLTNTGIPVERRTAVLHFIGTAVVQKQTQNGSFKLEGNTLIIYDK